MISFGISRSDIKGFSHDGRDGWFGSIGGMVGVSDGDDIFTPSSNCEIPSMSLKGRTS